MLSNLTNQTKQKTNLKYISFYWIELLLRNIYYSMSLITNTNIISWICEPHKNTGTILSHSNQRRKINIGHSASELTLANKESPLEVVKIVLCLINYINRHMLEEKKFFLNFFFQKKKKFQLCRLIYQNVEDQILRNIQNECWSTWPS